MSAATITYYRPGEFHVSHMPFASLSEAVETVRAMLVPSNNIGRHPLLYGAGWRASWDGGRRRWSLTFTPDGIYKSCACRRAENAGVRYASHRRGYVASERAFVRFIASMVELEAYQAANADLIAANRVAA